MLQDFFLTGGDIVTTITLALDITERARSLTGPVRLCDCVAITDI